MFPSPLIEPLGDSALIVRFGDEVDPDANDRVIAFAEDIERYPLVGQRDVVPAYASLAIIYDPAVAEINGASYRSLEQTVRERLERVDVSVNRGASSETTIDIPVCYDHAFGLDLDAVATRAGLSIDDLIAAHSSPVYRVYMIGFTPGFPYLGDLDQRLTMPRLSTPRARVPAGSVAIGGSQTGIYPGETPGGWWIIGRTPVQLFDPSSNNPAMLKAGDSVRFLPITRAAYDAVAS